MNKSTKPSKSTQKPKKQKVKTSEQGKNDQKASKSGTVSKTKSSKNDDITTISQLEKMQKRIAELESVKNQNLVTVDKLEQIQSETSSKLESANQKLLTQENDYHSLKNTHRTSIQKFNLSVKNLALQHQDQIIQLKKAHERDFQKLVEKHKTTIGTLQNQIDQQTKRILQMEVESQMQIQKLKSDAENSHKTNHAEFESERAQMRAKFNELLLKETDRMRARHRTDLQEIQQHKNQHVNQLKATHQDILKQVKSQYEDRITKLNKITENLQTDNDQLRKKHIHTEKQLLTSQNESKGYFERCKELTKNLKKLRGDFQALEKRSAATLLSQERCQRLVVSLDKLQTEYDRLESHTLQVELERDELYDRFVAAIFEIQRRSSQENTKLENKMLNLIDDLELKDMQLRKVLQKMRHQFPSTT